jgi:uncharacterized FlgJ-related protein
MKIIVIAAAVLALAITNPSFAADDINRPGRGDWCYLPIRNPNTQEQRLFLEEVAMAARAAETKYGVPAAILTAMAAIESGYGLTRLAIKSNNIFAFKWPGAEIGKGYEKFVLWCQPDWDEGNVYPAFKTRAAAVDFVAWRLASSRHYRAATDAFRAKLKSGGDARKAALAWLEQIAPTYNYDGPNYIKRVAAIVKRPIKDSAVSMWEITK